MDTDIRTAETGAPTDLLGGMPATAGAGDAMGLDRADLDTFARIADQLIPAAHGMPSAGDVVGSDRLRFVLTSRPDLLEPLRAALRLELGADVTARLAKLADEPTNLAALELAIVAGYYTDKKVRELIEYPGQMAIDVKSWLVPPYLEEGLIDAVLARGAVWRDPQTGRRAVVENTPMTYAERFAVAAPAAEGGNDGRDGA
jgi:hypothetical protein